MTAPSIDDLLAEFGTEPFTLVDFNRERAELERRFLAVHGTHAEDIDVAIRRGLLPCTDSARRGVGGAVVTGALRRSRTMNTSHHLDAGLARWSIIHFAPVVISSGHATDVCRNCGDSHEAHAALGDSLPCPSKLNKRVLDLMRMAAEVLCE